MLQVCSRSIFSVIVLVKLHVSAGYRFISALPKKEQLQLDLSTPMGLPILEAPRAGVGMDSCTVKEYHLPLSRQGRFLTSMHSLNYKLY